MPADGLRAEPEPEWADAIRRGRRDRAERLRTVFASFDDEDAGGVVPPQIDRSDTPSRQGPPRERPEP